MDDQPDFEDVSPLLIIPGEILPCRVLIDSGAAGNFISLHLVENLGCSVHRLRNPVTVRVANGHDIPIGTFARVTFRMRTLCVLGVLRSRPMAQWEAALVKPRVCLWATRKRLLGDGAFFVEAGSGCQALTWALAGTRFDLPLWPLLWRARVCGARHGLVLMHQLHKVTFPGARKRLANR